MEAFVPKLTVLGCVSGTPTATESTCGVLVEYSYGSYLLYDCPEGTYSRLLRHKIRMTSIHYIVISHMHTDHVSGLLSLLSGLFVKYPAANPIVYGPPAIVEFVQTVLRLTWTESRLSSPLQVLPITPCQPVPGISGHKDEQWSLIFFPLVHRIECFGLAMVRSEFLTFDTKTALDSGVTLDQLPELRACFSKSSEFAKRNSRVVLMLCSDNNAEQLLQVRNYAGIDGMTFTDFLESFDLYGPNLLLHEYTFMNTERQKADLYGHSCTDTVGALCDVIRPKRVLLNHFSVRYRRDREAAEFGRKPSFRSEQFTEWYKLFGMRFSTAFAVEDAKYYLL